MASSVRTRKVFILGNNNLYKNCVDYEYEQVLGARFHTDHRYTVTWS